MEHFNKLVKTINLGQTLNHQGLIKFFASGICYPESIEHASVSVGDEYMKWLGVDSEAAMREMVDIVEVQSMKGEGTYTTPAVQPDLFSYYSPVGGAGRRETADASHKAEIQRLKDQLIEKERDLIRVRHRLEDIQRQNDNLLDEVSVCRRADAIQKKMLLGVDQQCTLLHEQHRGVVSRVIGDEVEVTYETDDDGEPFKQVYQREQFDRSVLPRAGTWLDTLVVMVALNKETEEAKSDSDTNEDTIPSFDDIGVSGPVTL